MNPVAGRIFSGNRSSNGDPVLMMGKHQLAAAGMNVIPFTEIFHGHGRTLEMPRRSDIAPRRLGIDAPFQLRKPGSFQQREIAGVVLFIFIQIHGGTEPYLVDIHSRQSTVLTKPRNIEIDGPQFFIGIPFFDQLSGQRHHVVNMLTGTGIFCRRFDT